MEASILGYRLTLLYVGEQDRQLAVNRITLGQPRRLRTDGVVLYPMCAEDDQHTHRVKLVKNQLTICRRRLAAKLCRVKTHRIAALGTANSIKKERDAERVRAVRCACAENQSRCRTDKKNKATHARVEGRGRRNDDASETTMGRQMQYPSALVMKRPRMT